jgi:hypothetical protein
VAVSDLLAVGLAEEKGPSDQPAVVPPDQHIERAARRGGRIQIAGSGPPAGM